MVKRFRRNREIKTLQVMIQLYCRRNHIPSAGLCMDCSQLLEFSLNRLQNCPFGDAKTTCLNCPLHCYNPEMRDRIRIVMRYSGPRMLLYHPILALQHVLDSLRDKQHHKKPSLPSSSR